MKIKVLAEAVMCLALPVLSGNPKVLKRDCLMQTFTALPCHLQPALGCYLDAVIFLARNCLIREIETGNLHSTWRCLSALPIVGDLEGVLFR